MALDVEDLFRRYGAMVHRRCKRLLKNEDQARDAAQDVFVRLVSRRDTLSDGEHIGALLWTMATQVSLNRLRGQKRKPEDGAELLDVLANADDPEERMWLRRAVDAVFASETDALRASTRALAVMRFVDGMTLEEVATASGMSVAGVRKRLARLRERVAALREPSVVSEEVSL